MKRIATTFSMIVASGLFLGCDTRQDASATTRPAAAQPGTASPTVGIIDIDRLGKAMGWQAEATANFQAADAEAKRQLDAHMKMVQTQVDARKKAIIAEANFTPEQAAKVESAKDKGDLEKLGMPQKQIDEMMQLGNALMSERNQLPTAYQQFMQQRQTAIRAAYREAMGPAVRRIAQANDRNVIMMQSDQLLFADSSADLTDKLIDDLQKSPPLKINLPEIPKATDSMPTASPTSMPASTQP